MTKNAKERTKRLKFDRDRPPYDRQTDETDRQWEAFMLYRNMGSDRTLRATAEKYRELHGLTSKPASTERTVQMWSVRWRWRDRCAAWEREVDKKARRIALDEVARMNARHIKLAESTQALAASELKKLLAKTKQTKEVTVEVGDFLRVMEAGVKLERLARGEPDTIHEERKELDGDEKRKALTSLLKSPKAMRAVDDLMEEADKLDKDSED
jgi:hypothetical protein